MTVTAMTMTTMTGKRARAPRDTMTVYARTNIFFLLFTDNPKRGRVPPRDNGDRESVPGSNVAERAEMLGTGGREETRDPPSVTFAVLPFRDARLRNFVGRILENTSES